MHRIQVSAVLLFFLLGCEAREQPHAPQADTNATGEAPDAVVYDQSDPEAGALPDHDDHVSPIAAPAEPAFLPENCLALKRSDPRLPSGVYSIYPYKDAAREIALTAACDMETDGGGWTLILNYNHKGATNPELNVRIDSLPLLGSDGLGVDESLEPEYWGHAGNDMMRSLSGFRELRFYCRSAENTRVLHFKTRDASCLSAVQLGSGSCANIRNNFVAMNEHSALLPGALDRAESDRYDQTLTYNTFGKDEVDTPDRMWSIRAEPSQQAWECDYGTNNALFHTLHRVWIR